jgi:chemotaxis protein histidine kinase CheA
MALPLMPVAMPSEQALLTIVAAEAQVHLDQIEAGTAALGQGRDREVLGALLDALHTLAGAARSVELLELECLCRALERACAAARDAGMTDARRDAVASALALAPQLIVQPSGRTRNLALALCGQLDALSAKPAQPAPRS